VKKVIETGWYSILYKTSDGPPRQAADKAAQQ